MRNNKFARNRMGMTLVELVIAMTILLMVLAVGYPFYSFSVKAYDTGETQSIMQSDIRSVAAFVTREIRYATEIELVNTPVPTTGDGYYYISVENARVKYTNTTGNQTDKTEDIITGSTIFTLALESGRNIVSFTFQGVDGNQDFNLDTKVILNNIRNKPATTNSAIKYKLPPT